MEGILNSEEQERYARHFALPHFGESGQLKLKNACVLVVGAGGLGCPTLSYLAAAGVGKIGICDPDVVALSNLQRQVLYGIADIGRLKTTVAREKLMAQNPHLDVVCFPVALTAENAFEILKPFQIIVDCSDNFPTRYLINDACFLLGKPLVFGAIFRYEAQISVFNLPETVSERGFNYRDFFPEPPPPFAVPDCAEGGVLGALCGLVGSLQAVEVFKILVGFGETLHGKILLLDAANWQFRTLRLQKDLMLVLPQKLLDYQVFCGFIDEKTLVFSDLKHWRSENRPFILLDVREPDEYTRFNIGGRPLALSTLRTQPKDYLKGVTDLNPQMPLVLHCRTGKRAREAAQLLRKAGYENLYVVEDTLDEKGRE
jgi:sulfur-carrier protein adenylyltransferase/sulfurtransferase